MTDTTDRTTDTTAPAPEGAMCRSGAGAALTRRCLLAAGAVAGLGVLVGCSDSSETGQGGEGGAGASAGGASSAAGGASAGGSASGGSGGGGKALAKVSGIPVGGAVAASAPDGSPILLTQPTAGTIKGLSAICTHAGCTVVPAGKELDCPCHGSRFSLTGKNLSGPAPTPLPDFKVTVKDGQVFPA